jgi:hypothetical protein
VAYEDGVDCSQRSHTQTPSKEEEGIAFGSIPEAASVALHSRNRIRSHPNADATHMERARELERTRDSTIGMSSISKLSFF